MSEAGRPSARVEQRDTRLGVRQFSASNVKRATDVDGGSCLNVIQVGCSARVARETARRSDGGTLMSVTAISVPPIVVP